MQGNVGYTLKKYHLLWAQICLGVLFVLVDLLAPDKEQKIHLYELMQSVLVRRVIYIHALCHFTSHKLITALCAELSAVDEESRFNNFIVHLKHPCKPGAETTPGLSSP